MSNFWIYFQKENKIYTPEILDFQAYGLTSM